MFGYRAASWLGQAFCHRDQLAGRTVGIDDLV